MRPKTEWIVANMIPIRNKTQETGDLRINHAPNEQEAQEIGQSASVTPRSITLVAMRPTVKIFNKIYIRIWMEQGYWRTSPSKCR